MIEVKVPLVRITEWRDNSVYRTEPAGEVWIPLSELKIGASYGDDKNLRIGTPDEFIVRRT